MKKNRWSTVLVTGAALLVLALPKMQAATARTAPPNIVLLMADDLGWGDTGYNGHPQIKTAVLDQMARSGVRFDRFYSAHPMCSPMRASVLTGRNNNRCGVFFPGIALPPGEITLAQRLKAVRYATGHFGKWHLGGLTADSPTNPGAFGFDEWVSAINFYGPDPIFSRRGKLEQQQGEGSLLTVKEINDFISRQAAAKRPFLAVVWFGAVHGPQHTTKEFSDLYSGEPKDVAQYCGQTTAMDTAIGQLREALDKAGVRENTLVWFCSDNGGCGPVSKTGGRGKKAMIYEGGLRVPAVIEWPAVISHPIVSSLPATTSDIFPTCLAAAGLPLPTDRIIDGVSLLSLLRTGEQARPPIGFWFMATYQRNGRWECRPELTPAKEGDRVGFSEFEVSGQGYMKPLLDLQQKGEPVPAKFSQLATGLEKAPWPEDRLTGHAAWLDWPWKLHRIQNDEKNVPWALYNLADDPMEEHDQLKDQPDRVAAMRAALEQWQHSVIASLNGKEAGTTVGNQSP